MTLGPNESMETYLSRKGSASNESSQSSSETCLESDKASISSCGSDNSEFPDNSEKSSFESTSDSIDEISTLVTDEKSFDSRDEHRNHIGDGNQHEKNQEFAKLNVDEKMKLAELSLPSCVLKSYEYSPQHDTDYFEMLISNFGAVKKQMKRFTFTMNQMSSSEWFKRQRAKNKLTKYQKEQDRLEKEEADQENQETKEQIQRLMDQIEYNRLKDKEKNIREQILFEIHQKPKLEKDECGDVIFLPEVRYN